MGALTFFLGALFHKNYLLHPQLTSYLLSLRSEIWFSQDTCFLGMGMGAFKDRRPTTLVLAIVLLPWGASL